MAGHESADVAELVGDGLGGDIVVVEIAADAVEFVGDEVEGDVVGGVICKGEVVASLVVQAGDLESGADEGSVAGRVGGERGFEVEMIAVGIGGAFGEPERVFYGRGVETDAGQGAPEFEAVFLLPGEDAGVGQGGVEEGEDAHKVGVGGLVRGSGDLAVPRNVAQALVEDARRGAEEVGAVVGPGHARHCLDGRTFGRVQIEATAFAVDVAEGGVVFFRVVGTETDGRVCDEMLVEFAICLALNRQTQALHTVERGLVEADRSLWSVGVVWVHGDDSDWVGGVVAEFVQSGRGTVGVLAIDTLSLVKEIEHCLSDCDAKLIAQG